MSSDDQTPEVPMTDVDATPAAEGGEREVGASPATSSIGAEREAGRSSATSGGLGAAEGEAGVNPATTDGSGAMEGEAGVNPATTGAPVGGPVFAGEDGPSLAMVIRIALALILVSILAGVLLGLAIREEPAPSPAASAEPASEAGPTTWTCSMHPSVKLPEFGPCPLCGMDLIPLQPGGAQEPRVLELSEAAAKLAGVETIPAERRAVTREVRMVGLVEVDETRLHYVTAWFPGRLDRLFVDYTGTPVNAGDHLAEVYSPELLTAQEELLQALAARAKLNESSSEFLRTSADRTVSSAREKLRLWGLSAEQIAAIEREGKSSDHVTIHATSGGVVVHKSKNRGDYVKTGERIYAIADLSQVWVKLDAYESDLGAVAYHQEVRFETEAYPGQTFTGRVVFVDPVVTRHTRTVKVRLNVANAEGRLKPGMFVRATLQAPIESDGRALAPAVAGKWICPMHREEIHDEPGKCSECAMPLVKGETLFGERAPEAKRPLVIPASAVLWTGVRSVVYVQREGTHEYEGRQVVLGPRAGGVYVVREGLREGERVVTKGAFKLDSALQIEARPSMMLPPEGSDASSEALEVTAGFRKALAPVYRRYLEAQAALARDEVEPARASLKGLVGAVRALDSAGAPEQGLGEEGLRRWVALAKRLRDAGAKGAAAGEIAAVRAAFQGASQAILELERSFGHAKGRFVEAYCPMAFDDTGAAWLQVGEQIDNPYFGASMLRCGEVRARFEARGESAHAAQSDRDTGSQPVPSPTPSSTPTPSQRSGESGALREQLGGVVEAYLALQKDLSQDRARGATHSKALRAALATISSEGLSPATGKAWSEALPALEASLTQLAGAKGIAAERVAFQKLSQALDGLLSRVGTPSGVTLRRFHCSMAFDDAGADWLQVAERTENPYFGSGMYRCGNQVEVLSGAPSAGGGR